MRRFAFTLGRLQDYKEQLLDREKNTLGQLQHRRAELEQTLENLRTELVNTDARLKERQRQGVTIVEARRYEFQIENMRLLIRQTETELAAAAERVERQMRVVVAASQEVAGLEKLEQKQREEYRVEAAREEESVLSDFISSKLARELGSH